MPKLGIVDVPSARRAHARPTPRGGGVSFVIIFSVIFPIFEYWVSGEYSLSVKLLQVLLPLSVISFLDDVSHVMIPLRLVVHAVCACFAVMWLVHPNNILHYEIPNWLDLVIGTFALITFLNVYNFLDGIDGITVSESIHLSITILLLCILRHDIIPNVNNIMAIATIIFGWSMGFIFFNWQPAKIFLGDVGSISIGFVLGICLLMVASASARLFMSCVIASLYYIADGGMTILIRLVKGERIWEPHLKHFFQKAVRSGKSHRYVVMRITKCNILLMLFALNALYYPVVSAICAILVVMVTVIRLVG
jgi:UDP-N-acetylmuramyl pentapeptide phosphotransferase/UDP-N-acetylglucosamine-1-phosphate transferase